MCNNICIYRHLKSCGEVFYIGIGSIKRPYSKSKRSNFWNDTINKYGYEVQILKSNLNWNEAIELEKILISYYGRRDLKTGTLVNFTDGGEGSPGKIVSEETRIKMSNFRKNYKHSKETKLKISERNKNKIFSEESKLKMSESSKNKLHTDVTKQKIAKSNRKRKGIKYKTRSKT